jgi:hypothetical protein
MLKDLPRQVLTSTTARNSSALLAPDDRRVFGMLANSILPGEFYLETNKDENLNLVPNDWSRIVPFLRSPKG